MQAPPVSRLYVFFDVHFILVAGKAMRALQTVRVRVNEFVFVADSSEKSEVLTQSDNWDDEIYPEWNHRMLQHRICAILCILHRSAVVALDTNFNRSCELFSKVATTWPTYAWHSLHRTNLALNYFITVDDCRHNNVDCTLGAVTTVTPE